MNAKENVASAAVMQVATTRQFGDMEIQVYENPAVNHMRPQDDLWMTREQIGTALEYGDPIRSISKIHERNTDRLDPLSSVVNLTTEVGKHTQMRQIYVYSLRGVMEICRYSKQPKANAFMDFCWDVMTALMRGETVSLESRRQAEERAMTAKRQANFEVLNHTLHDLGDNQQLLYAQYEELSKYRAEDRQAIENVLSYDRTLIEMVKRVITKADMVLQGIERLVPSDPNVKSVKFTKFQVPASDTSWSHDTKLMIKAIADAHGEDTGRVRGWFHNLLKTEYGWSVYEERKKYAEEYGIDDVQSIPCWAVIENDSVIRCVFYNRVADRYEECTGRKVERMEEPKKKPPMIPLDAIPKHNPVVVAEAHAVEVETPVVETPAVEVPATKKKGYYKPSITLPIVEPIAKKLGDKTIGYRITYAKIYNVIGVTKMDRMRRAYIRTHNKPPKSTPDIFQNSEKNMKVFKEAARALDAIF